MIHDYDDGRGRYPDLLSVRAPAGLREQVRQAAQTERLPMAEYVRQALAERMARTTRAAAHHDGERSTMS